MIQHYFKYGEKEVNYLKSKDKKLAKAIDLIGTPNRIVIPDLFTALVNTIIGQQISNKAHNTIWERLQNRLKKITPHEILNLSDQELQSIGISFKKVGYIKNIAHKIIDGELEIDKLYDLSNDEIFEELIELKGIGKWSAEMMMIFSMQRKDVLSFGDLAIIKGLRMLYHHRKITPELFNKYKRRYSPYASIASFYLWAIASDEIPEMKDYAPKKKK